MESIRIKLDDKTKEAIRRIRGTRANWNLSEFVRKSINRAAAQTKEAGK